MVVWPSWPQACMTSGVCERWANSLASGIGSASMSARMPIARGECRCAACPPARCRRSRASPRSPRRRASRRRGRWCGARRRPVPGGVCMSRRHAVMSAAKSAMRLWTGMRNSLRCAGVYRPQCAWWRWAHNRGSRAITMAHAARSTGFYPSYAEAVEVVADLTSAAGISATDVSLIESETDAAAAAGGRASDMRAEVPP